MKNQNGFSMIEVMMVVAIVAFAATMAIPSYSAMIAKSRQSEARSELSQMYAKEISYFAEFGRYTTCLWQAGYNPPEGARRYYSTGYLNAGPTADFTYGGEPEPQNKPVPDFGGRTCDCGIGFPAWGGQGAGGRNDCTFIANSAANPALLHHGVTRVFDASKTAFNAGAWGSISGARVLDVWQIDNNKVITNLQGGL